MNRQVSNREELLRESIAEFLNVAPATLTADFPLTAKKLASSIGRAALDALIRRKLGVTSAAVYKATQYGELETAVLGASEADSRPAKPVEPRQSKMVAISSSQPETSDGKAAGCGVDLELVANLPKVVDYWQDEFYKSSFTSGEIAYCSLQQDPPMHFAARWCAKEALKKCDQNYLLEPLATLELAKEDSGRVVLRQLLNGSVRVLPFAVSVSHTPLAAVAVVVRSPQLASAVSRTPAPPPAIPSAPPTFTATLALLLSVISTALVILTLIRTFNS